MQGPSELPLCATCSAVQFLFSQSSASLLLSAWLACACIFNTLGGPLPATSSFWHRQLIAAICQMHICICHLQDGPSLCTTLFQARWPPPCLHMESATIVLRICQYAMRGLHTLPNSCSRVADLSV